MKIKTFEDACASLNIPATLPDVSMLAEKDQKPIIAAYKLFKIAEALNEGWLPDWSNYNQCKYYLWFNMDAAGFGFAYHSWSSGSTYTGVGSRLCFKKSRLAEYAGKQFEAIYKDLYTL